MDSNRVTPSLHFGVFEMDLRTGELRKSGVLIHLGPQPFKVLALLAGKPGELVTREEIQREIWGETTFVDYEQGLRVAIKKIRAALGDSSVSPRYIETLSRRGYRFIAHVEKVPPASPPADAGADTVSAQAVPPIPPPTPPWNRWLLAGGVAIATALVLIALNVGSVRGRLFDAVEARPPAPVSKIRSLAVLPLENVSGDRSQDFFSAGLTDELTTDLAEVPSLRVVSRTSAMVYKVKQTPLPQIARTLNVDAVVEGTAMHDGGRVRITAQLIDARKDKTLWAGSFEGKAADVLQLEDDVARQIASYVTASISSPRAPVLLPHPAQSTNPAAQDAYWRGRILFDRREVGGEESAVEDFRKAIKIDPRYARAYAGLAQALLSQSYLQAARAKDVIGKARNAAERALEFDPNLSEAYCALGMIQGTYDYDWEGAKKSLHRSLALNPNNSLSEIILSGVLTAEGRSKDAVAHARRALKLDPLSFFANRNLASILYFARRYDKALAQLQRARVLRDYPGVIDNWIGWIYEVRGNYDLAEKYNLKVLAVHGVPPAQLARYRAAYRRGGWKRYWWAQLHDRPQFFLLRRNATSGCVGYYVGLADLNMGSKDAALDELSRAVNQHCVWTMWLKVDPRLDSLHSDPRFGKLLARLNLVPTGVSANR